MYKSLDSPKLIQRAQLLQKRIDERFPESGIRNVCRELVEFAQESDARADQIMKPEILVRLVVIGLIALIIGAFIVALAVLPVSFDDRTFTDFVTVLEPGLNIVLITGGGIFFLITLETRRRRTRVMRYIHQARSLAHVIDMHQINKDPYRLLAQADTGSSPKMELSPFELGRYLIYCIEMLSLIGKISALYIRDFDDSVALASVNEVENLTSSMTRNIWQKLAVLHSITEGDPPRHQQQRN